MRQSTSITGSVRRLVGLSVCLLVTHSFDDPHVAPYWPTWPCYLTHTISFRLDEGFSKNFGFLWFALSRFLEIYLTCLVDFLKGEEQRTHLYACEYARKTRDDIISQNNDRIWHHLLSMTAGWYKMTAGFYDVDALLLYSKVFSANLWELLFQWIKWLKKSKKKKLALMKPCRNN